MEPASAIMPEDKASAQAKIKPNRPAASLYSIR